MSDINRHKFQRTRCHLPAISPEDYVNVNVMYTFVYKRKPASQRIGK